MKQSAQMSNAKNPISSVCPDAVGPERICRDPVCLDPVCLDPVCLHPVCLDPVCLETVWTLSVWQSFFMQTNEHTSRVRWGYVQGLCAGVVRRGYAQVMPA